MSDQLAIGPEVAPPGHHYAWVEDDYGWVVLDKADEHRCRYVGGHPQAHCPNRAVAALNRKRWWRGRFVDSWWHYCADHLYGRQVVDGVLYIRRLVRDEP
jgi:hypothetical protein